MDKPEKEKVFLTKWNKISFVKFAHLQRLHTVGELFYNPLANLENKRFTEVCWRCHESLTFWTFTLFCNVARECTKMRKGE